MKQRIKMGRCEVTAAEAAKKLHSKQMTIIQNIITASAESVEYTLL